MSDLEDLEDITEANHFGTGSNVVFSGPHGTLENRRKSHCSAGHEFTEENTRWYRKRNGGRRRVCLACSRMHSGFKNIYKPRLLKQCSSTATGNAIGIAMGMAHAEGEL